jgi:hypothetical protein
MQVESEDLKHTIQDITDKKKRCEVALNSPDVSDRVKVRLLQPEYTILCLALEGAHTLFKKTELNRRDVSFAIPPVQTVGPPTD